MAARKWTNLQRKTQSRAIKRWKPWQYSTGPITVQGKATSSKNSFMGGCNSIWVRRLRQMERDMRRSKSATISATRKLESYRQEVEKRIADNALMKRDPRILVQAFGFLSAEISRTSRLILKDLGFAKDLPGGPGAFIRRFEWEMAVLRANTSIQENRNSQEALVSTIRSPRILLQFGSYESRTDCVDDRRTRRPGELGTCLDE